MSGPTTLTRRLGLFETTVSGVGIILGAGIYALVGEAAGISGNAVWLAFVIAAAVSGLTGLSYAELASAYPRAGADYEYVKRGLGMRAGFVAGWLMIISNLVGAAAVALGFAGYLSTFFAGGISETAVAVAALAVCTIIAFIGVREAIAFSIVLTFIEAAGLIAVIVIGIPFVGDHDLLAGAARPGALLSGAALVTFAFVGFSQIATLAEETVDAPRVIPRAILLSIAVTTLLYVLVAVAAISAIGAEALAASEAPLADVAASAIGPRTRDVIAVVALFSTANTMLLLFMAASRMLYGMASGPQNALPRFIGWVHPGVHTPARAIIVSMVVAIAFALVGNLRFAAQASNVAVFIAFFSINLALIVLRYREPAHPRPFRVPGSLGRLPALPAIALVTVFALLVSLDGDALLAGGILFVLGIAAASIARLWQPRASA